MYVVCSLGFLSLCGSKAKTKIKLKVENSQYYNDPSEPNRHIQLCEQVWIKEIPK